MFGIKTKILTYLRNKFQLNNRLRNIRIFPIGYVCNHQCPMCWRMQLSSSMHEKFMKEELHHLSLKEYVRIINCLPKHVQTVEIVGGGEPLLYPDITKLLKLIKRKNIYGRLITNGSLLNNQISRDLVNYAWDEVRISFHAGSSKVYKVINGVDDYTRVLNNIRYLISLKKSSVLPKINLLFVIQHGNVRDIKPFVQNAIELGVDEIEFDSLIPFTSEKLFLTDKDRNIVIKTFLDLQKKLTIKNNIGHAINMFTLHGKWNGNIHSLDYFKNKYCQIVQYNLDINSDGVTIPCCLYPHKMQVFNIRNGSVKEAYNYYQKFRRDLARGRFYDFCYRFCNYGLEER